jgi:hypothetical protein
MVTAAGAAQRHHAVGRLPLRDDPAIQTPALTRPDRRHVGVLEIPGTDTSGHRAKTKGLVHQRSVLRCAAEFALTLANTSTLQGPCALPELVHPLRELACRGIAANARLSY